MFLPGDNWQEFHTCTPLLEAYTRVSSLDHWKGKEQYFTWVNRHTSNKQTDWLTWGLETPWQCCIRCSLSAAVAGSSLQWCRPGCRTHTPPAMGKSSEAPEGNTHTHSNKKMASTQHTNWDTDNEVTVLFPGVSIFTVYYMRDSTSVSNVNIIHSMDWMCLWLLGYSTQYK